MRAFKLSVPLTSCSFGKVDPVARLGSTVEQALVEGAWVNPKSMSAGDLSPQPSLM